MENLTKMLSIFGLIMFISGLIQSRDLLIHAKIVGCVIDKKKYSKSGRVYITLSNIFLSIMFYSSMAVTLICLWLYSYNPLLNIIMIDFVIMVIGILFRVIATKLNRNDEVNQL